MTIEDKKSGSRTVLVETNARAPARRWNHVPAKPEHSGELRQMRRCSFHKDVPARPQPISTLSKHGKNIHAAKPPKESSAEQKGMGPGPRFERGASCKGDSKNRGILQVSPKQESYH